MATFVVRTSMLLILAGFVAGCRGGNPNAPASLTGRVTYKGEPLPGGNIVFHGADSGNSAMIDNGAYAGGNFTVGEFIVTIETESLNPDQATKAYPGGGKMGAKGKEMMKGMPAPEGVAAAQKAKYVKIPAKYADKDTSGLKVTLSPGKQTKDFDLTD